ncbi:MAG TPA: hypothetical protein PLC32_03040 [Candidatus Omnitrophota bacterium]|nr:hypothetical protein [Candidatus Omnitrophota bacterium]
MKVLFSVLIFLASVSVANATEVVATWDDAAQALAGWQGVAVGNSLVYHDTEGNPGGYIEAYGNFNSGISSNQQDFTGNFSEKNYNRILIDIKPIMVAVAACKPGVYLRYSASFAAWKYILNNFTNTAGAWQHFEVNFNPAWTDAEAQANGWSLEEGPAKSFAETMAHVGSVAVKIKYISNAAAYIGYDNFTLKYVAPPATKSIGQVSGSKTKQIIPSSVLGTKNTQTQGKK